MLLIIVLSLFASIQQAESGPVATAGSFVGTWVGTQTWALETPPPGAVEPQEVTLTIEDAGGHLVGTLSPFFGGVDGASFADAQIVGDHLEAIGRMGNPRADEPAAGSRNQPRGWKDAVHIRFAFRPDRNALQGTADIDMSGVPWMKFKYDLGKKRSRY
jgi:hypothetical protein